MRLSNAGSCIADIRRLGRTGSASIHLEPTAWIGELRGAPTPASQFRFLGGRDFVTLSHRIQSVGFDSVSQNQEVITEYQPGKSVTIESTSPERTCQVQGSGGLHLSKHLVGNQ